MNRAPYSLTIFSGLAVVALLAASCGPGNDTPEPPGPPVSVIALLNDAPVLEVGDLLYLDGQDSHLGANTEGLGLSLTWIWSVSSRPVDSVLISEDFTALDDEDGEPTPALVSLLPDVQGLYGITLQVSDGERISDLAHLTIEIGGGNACPTADAGDDLTALRDIPVELDGSGSSDPDIAETGDDDDSAGGQELDFIWHFSLVPEGSELTDTNIFHQGTGHPLFIPDVDGTYILQLRVTDGLCLSLPDYVTVQVTSENLPPVANAGPSRVLTPCSPTEITLDGTASYDPEGSPVQFEWSFTAVPNGSDLTDAYIDGRFTETPSFNWDIPGIYALQVVVSDGQLLSDPNYVAIQAIPSLPNGAPVAFAGEDVLVDANANCTTTPYGGGSCLPCGARSVILSAENSSDPDGDQLNYQWDKISGVATLSGAESVTVELELPELPVAFGSQSSVDVELGLTIFDCRAADDDFVTITFTCHG